MSKRNKDSVRSYKKMLYGVLMLAVLLSFILYVLTRITSNDSSNARSAELYLHFVEYRLTYVSLYQQEPQAIDFSSNLSNTLISLEELRSEIQLMLERKNFKTTDPMLELLNIIKRQEQSLLTLDENFMAFKPLYEIPTKSLSENNTSLRPIEELHKDIDSLSAIITTLASTIRSEVYPLSYEHIVAAHNDITYITNNLDTLTSAALEARLTQTIASLNQLKITAYEEMKHTFATEETLTDITTLTNTIQQMHASLILE